MFKDQQHTPTIVFGTFCLLLLAYHLIFRDFFPLPNGLMGHDYVLTLASLLDGYLWFKNNGFWIAPWFTPSFCGGQPYFSDPQSIFYSLPQFLAFVVDPLRAAYVAFLIFACAAFWGMYLFARQRLRVEPVAALAAATVFMFNGFYSTRMIVGHYGFQSFALAPMLAWLLLGSTEEAKLKTRALIETLLAGILIAYCFHSGITTLMIPLGISVAALACLAQMIRQQPLIPTFIYRGIFASIIAIGLCASKLNANFALMGNFQRDYYPLPGISDPFALVKFLLESLFYSGEHVYRSITPYWQNMQWSAMPHELSYNLTPLTLIILLLGMGKWLTEGNPFRRMGGTRRTQYVAALLLLAILLIPVGLLYYTPEWNALLKSLPLVGSTTSPFRWLIIYLPLTAALVALATRTLGKFGKAALIAILIGIPALNILEQRPFLESQEFDPTPIVDYYWKIRSGEKKPGIQQIGIADKNNGQIANSVSPAYCYNPLFGYQLEKYRLQPLVIGAVREKTPSGTLNLRNPACMVFPTENACKVWDAFAPGQINDLENFANYQPLHFERSTRQKFADGISLFSLLSSALSLVVLLFIYFRQNLEKKSDTGC